MTTTIDASVDAEATSAQHRELEWQLATTDLAGVRHWVADHPTVEGWIVEPRATIELRDTYFDTEDWRIYREGLALRVRDASGKPEATLKELRSARHDVADRGELTEPLPAPTLEALPGLKGPVGTRVHAVTGMQPLRPLFTTHTLRERYLVRREGSSENVGELALDETSIADPDGNPRSTLQRVEVEAVGPAGETLADFVNVLRRDCALEPANDSKYQVGLKSVGLAPHVSPPPAPDINAAMHMDELARVALRQYLSAWRTHEPATRLGEDPEALHDLRIAGRRIDAALSLFADELPARLVKMRSAFKERVRTLGITRDLDVALVELDKFAQGLDAAERQALAPVQRHLAVERSRAHAKMVHMLDAEGTRRCLVRLEEAAAPGTTPREPSPEATAVIPSLLRSRYKKLRKAVKRLTAQSPAEERHAVRARVKKLRYAVEPVAPLYGKPAQSFLRALRRMQDHLGEEHDSHVMRDRLRALSQRQVRGMTPATMFLLGQMAERQSPANGRHEARAEHRMNRQMRKRWKKLRRTLNRSAQERLAGSAPASDGSFG